MFWGITCEKGKRYSQIPTEPFCVSMAALEPQDDLPDNKQVCLMVEHKGKEYLICTLEYGRVMQVNLDMKFSVNEETILFVSGDGTIHLSGHMMNDKKILISEKPSSKGIKDSCNNSEDALPYDPLDFEKSTSEEDEDGDVLDTNRLLDLDDSDEEDDEEDDWQPPVTEFDDIFGSQYFVNRPKTRSNHGKHVNFAENDIADDDESYVLPLLEMEDGEMDDGDVGAAEYGVDEEVEGEENNDDLSENDSEDYEEDEGETVLLHEELLELKKKRKSPNQNNSISKKPKTEGKKSILKPTVVECAIPTNDFKKTKKMKKKKEKSFTGEKELQEESDEEQVPNDMNSSIGRTPMPKKKLSAFKTGSASFIQPIQTSTEKRSGKKPPKFNNKLPGGVEFEDIRVGSGPIAKGGKLIHVCYVGQFLDGEVFDKSMDHHKPYSFRLGRGEVIKGWDFGIEGMRVGGKRRLKIPPNMGYGKKTNNVIPGNSTLMFNVELKAVS